MLKLNLPPKIRRSVSLLSLLLGLSACGGASTVESSTPVPTPLQPMAGSIVRACVNRTIVWISDLNGNQISHRSLGNGLAVYVVGHPSQEAAERMAYQGYYDYTADSKDIVVIQLPSGERVVVASTLFNTVSRVPEDVLVKAVDDNETCYRSRSDSLFAGMRIEIPPQIVLAPTQVITPTDQIVTPTVVSTPTGVQIADSTPTVPIP